MKCDIKVLSPVHIGSGDKYTASEYIKSKAKTKKGNILKGTQTNAGYKKVGLYKNGKGTFKYIHRMVLETFLPNENSEKLQVNHKDGDKSNNTLENLEWVTSSENKIHARDTLKIAYSTEAAHKARQQKIKVTDINTKETQIFDSMKDCANYFGIPYRTIQEWELGNRSMPQYLLRLMSYKVQMEKLNK